MKSRASEGSSPTGKDPRRAAPEYSRLDGVYEQSGGTGLRMVRIRASGCRWESGHLNAAAQIASSLGDGTLHFTTRGDVELHGVKTSDLGQVFDLLHQAGLSGRGCCGDAVRNVIACAGSGVCPEEKFDAAELARRISREYTGSAAYEHLPRKFKISISGCEKACACPQIQDVGIVAGSLPVPDREPGLCFDVYLGGGLGRNPILARKMKRLNRYEDVLLFMRAALDCFNELGERTRQQRARMKFLAETLGHEQLLHRIMEKATSKTWGYQI